MAIVLLVVAVALPARADLAVNQPAKDEWGSPEIALRMKAHGRVYALFVLYANGRVLYRDRAGGSQPSDYLFVALTPEEKRALVAGLPIDRIGEEVGRGFVSACEDCATYCVDGLSAGSYKQQCTYGGPSPRVHPAAFAIFDRLSRFASPRAVRWVPPHITVTVQADESSHGSPGVVEWPRKWPLSGTPIRLFGRDGWTFTLDGSELPEVRRVYAQSVSRWGAMPFVAGDKYLHFSFDYALPHEADLRTFRRSQ
jgi:hypothetical protein